MHFLYSVYRVTVVMLFTINVGRIVTYYVYTQWYLKKDSPCVNLVNI